MANNIPLFCMDMITYPCPNSDADLANLYQQKSSRLAILCYIPCNIDAIFVIYFVVVRVRLINDLFDWATTVKPVYNDHLMGYFPAF